MGIQINGNRPVQSAQDVKGGGNVERPNSFLSTKALSGILADRAKSGTLPVYHSQNAKTVNTIALRARA